MFGRLQLKWRRITFIFISLLLVIVIYISYAIRTWRCSNMQSLEIITNMCNQYENGEVEGNMCDPICKEKSVKFQHCLNYNGGKIVLMCKRHNVDLMLKRFKHDKEFASEEIVDSLQLNDFYEMVANTLNFHFNIDLKIYASHYDIPLQKVGAHFASEMWTGGNIFKKAVAAHAKEHASNEKISVEMHSLWKLLQQDEYITLRMLHENPHIPEVIGTCGAMYALRPSPPGDFLSNGPPSIQLITSNNMWRERAEIALQLLDVVESFANLGNPFKQLHLCDIKGENFGVGPEGVIQAIDVDMAFVEDKMKSELESSNCTQHTDCDFFDCWGWCDKKIMKCTPIRRNNNLQGVCYKIFKSRAANALNGLLAYPPKSIKDHLTQVLQECIEPTDWKDEMTRYRAGDDVLMELRDILKRL